MRGLVRDDGGGRRKGGTGGIWSVFMSSGKAAEGEASFLLVLEKIVVGCEEVEVRNGGLTARFTRLRCDIGLQACMNISELPERSLQKNTLKHHLHTANFRR